MSDTRDILDNWNRKWKTLWYWSQLYVFYKTAQARGHFLKEDERTQFWEKKHLSLAEMVWSNITELRGWWVKVGQFLSTRGDVLPAQYISYLTKLQDTMPYSSFTVIKPIIERELDTTLETVFEEFEESPLASASIAQVHRARLRNTHERVVVKVQHPEVEKTLRQDMLTLAQMSWALGLVEGSFNVRPLLDEWQKSASDELDFRVEMKHQMRALTAVKRSGIRVIIPKCYPHLTTKRVLVMDYCEGFKITETQRLKENNVDYHKLMYNICCFFAYQIHIDGMFNGDPHPGNILVQADPEAGEYVPVLLDWGLVKTFTPSQCIAFSKMVLSVARVDIMGVYSSLEDLGFRFKKGTNMNPEVYIDTLRYVFFQGDRAKEKTPTNKKSTTETVLRSKNTLMEHNPIEDWPKDIIFVIRVASLLHGICLQLHVKIPFLSIFVEKAEQSLLQRFQQRSVVSLRRYPPAKFGRIRSYLEWSLYRHLVELHQKSLILGCQVAVFKDHKQVIDLCIGQLGPVDTRPVERSSLFPLMTASNGILATAVLQLMDPTSTPADDPYGINTFEDTMRLRLSDAVCDWWDGFIRFGKEKITVRDVLTHRAGFHVALPENLTLQDLMNYEGMVSSLEDMRFKEPLQSFNGCYAYLTSSYIFSELVRGVTGQRIDQYVQNQFIYYLGLSTEFYFPVPEDLLREATNKKNHKKAGKIIYETNFKGKGKHDKKGYATHELQSRAKSPIGGRNVDAELVHLNKRPNERTTSGDLQGLTTVKHTDFYSDLSPKACKTSISKRKMGKMKALTASHAFKTCGSSSEKTERNSFMDRLVSSSRAFNVERLISLLQRHDNNAPTSNSPFDSSQDHWCSSSRVPLASKYVDRCTTGFSKTSVEEDCKRVTALQLGLRRPFILDPLIYDGSLILSKLIPGMNCRITARALAYFYSSLCNGVLVDSKLLDMASHVATVDESLDCLLLTGGGSRLFGLGYQLYPCLKFSDERLYDTNNHAVRHNTNFYQEFNKTTAHQRVASNSTDSQIADRGFNLSHNFSSSRFHIVRGLGHGDTGGNIGLCFPELRLSIAILVNDMLTGSEASKSILCFILSAFGLKPCWDIPYFVDELLQNLRDTTSNTAQSQVATLLQKESQYSATEIYSPSKE